MRAIHNLRAVLVLACFFLLGACAGMPKPEMPKTVPERVEALNLLLDQASDRITSATCTRFKAKKCIEPGKPLMPADAMSAHDQIDKAHDTLTTVNAFGAGGAGECLGKVRSQAACLSAINLLLTEIDRMLIEKQGGQ